MAVRMKNWKLHIFTRGSHCVPPFPDSNCYDMDFRNASFYGNQPLLVNLDTDPGEAQLVTTVCDDPHDPRCYNQSFVDGMVLKLTTFYNTTVAAHSLWAPSQIDRGSNA